ncbi:chorismate--pyruvate lyase family protein [Alteromonas gilva]|uniref:Chorismate pyruvate-lyase family protein n=1 Tax=Alteromonas gilva TaxID=2987522 RepID=A0ABT5L7V8_9ALTE|nr:chorismate pyruvate-lyase family protein [Alteromonas gilva]MDC8833116.1 chorismate pyruvate-lyase family protein [Alteromonas gilva]
MIQESFKSRGFVAGDTIVNRKGERIDLSVLPAFLRTLLVTDGTVTKSLEAYFWEPVMVNNTLQDVLSSVSNTIALTKEEGQRYLHRKVNLSGVKTTTVYAFADSYINLSLLSADTAEKLIANKIGIGELLRDEGLETYREILDIGTVSDALEDKSVTEQCAYRTYVIKVSGAIAIEITEWFPFSAYC